MLGQTNIRIKPKKRINYVNYIESTGTQWIDTGYIFKSTKQRIEFNFTPLVIGDYRVCGSYVGKSDGNHCGMIVQPRKTNMVEVGNTSYTPSFSIEANTNYDVVLEANNGSFTLKLGNNTGTGTYTANNIITELTHFIFNVNYSGEPNPATMQLSYYRMYDDDVLVRDYRAVKDGAGVYCLYDGVEKRYYYNQGSGSFIGPGYTPIQLSYIKSTGTQYIDTGYFPKENSKFVIDLKDSDKSSYESYFGSTHPRLFRSSTSNNNLEFSCSNVAKIFSCDLSSRRTLVINNTGIYDENMNLIGSSSDNYVLSGDANPIMIFLSRYKGNLDKYGIYYLYGFKIYEGEELKHNYIPSLDMNDVVCLYDYVTQSFLYNKGSGEFTGGEAI